MTYMFMVSSRRIIVYGAKKLMGNHKFSGNGETYCSVVVITKMFLCFDFNCNFRLRKQQQQQ